MEDVDLPSLFRLAKNISKYSDYKIRVGAVICDKSRPISVGYNKNKFHPKYSTELKRTIHAEAAAIISSGKDIMKGATVFVYRENKKGRPALARPCINCMKLLQEFGVKKIFYTTNEYPYFNVERI